MRVCARNRRLNGSDAVGVKEVEEGTGLDGAKGSLADGLPPLQEVLVDAETVGAVSDTRIGLGRCAIERAGLHLELFELYRREEKERRRRLLVS